VKAFASDTKSFRIGEKKETKYDPSLGPGYYNQDKAQNHILAKSTTIAWSKEAKASTKRVDTGPDASDAHYKPFGSDLKRIDFGKKYDFKVDSNPPVGKYNVDNS